MSKRIAELKLEEIKDVAGGTLYATAIAVPVATVYPAPTSATSVTFTSYKQPPTSTSLSSAMRLL